MTRDQQKLARRLFAEATGLLEDTHIVAVKGQSPSLTAAECRRHATDLCRAARHLQAFAETLLALEAKASSRR